MPCHSAKRGHSSRHNSSQNGRFWPEGFSSRFTGAAARQFGSDRRTSRHAANKVRPTQLTLIRHLAPIPSRIPARKFVCVSVASCRCYVSQRESFQTHAPTDRHFAACNSIARFHYGLTKWNDSLAVGTTRGQQIGGSLLVSQISQESYELGVSWRWRTCLGKPE